MKLASFGDAVRESYGVVVGDHIVDLGRKLGDRYRDLRSLLADESGIAAAAEIVRGTAPDLAVSNIVWRPVIPNPDKVVCVGLNYKAHLQEVGRKVEDQPVLFLRSRIYRRSHRWSPEMLSPPGRPAV